MSEEKTVTKPSPPYVAYATFKNKVRSLKGHIPEILDGSMFSTMSGSGQQQFFKSLKFFQLIDENDRVSDDLKTLANCSDAEWLVAMEELIKLHYTAATLKALSSGTPQQLKDSLGGMGIAVPAARFLLAAARETALKVSPYIKQITGGPLGAKKKRNSGDNATEDDVVDKGEAPEIGAVSGEVVTNIVQRVELVRQMMPPFDPKWDKEVISNWMAATKELLTFKAELTK